MSGHLDFEAKSDRELLVLVAQKSNETVDHLAQLNDIIVKHEKRISRLETMQGCGETKRNWRSHWPTITLIASIIALIIIEIAKWKMPI
jgi:hypothetical protein